MIMEIVDYLDASFENKNKFLRKNNVPIVIVMSKIAIENNVKPELFKAFINDFANALYPAYEEASGSGNIKIVNVNQRLRVMFIAMGSIMNEPTEEVVDNENVDTEGFDAEEVADEAGENSGISAESE